MLEKIIIDGKEVTKEEFQAIQEDPKKKLKKLEEENTYKSLTRLQG